jgi:hypothetical protein
MPAVSTAAAGRDPAHEGRTPAAIASAGPDDVDEIVLAILEVAQQDDGDLL